MTRTKTPLAVVESYAANLDVRQVSVPVQVDKSGVVRVAQTDAPFARVFTFEVQVLAVECSPTFMPQAAEEVCLFYVHNRPYGASKSDLFPKIAVGSRDLEFWVSANNRIKPGQKEFSLDYQGVVRLTADDGLEPFTESNPMAIFGHIAKVGPVMQGISVQLRAALDARKFDLLADALPVV